MPTNFRLRTILEFVLVAALIGVMGVSLAAQTNTATILGTVTDASGGIIPDAKVTVTNTGTGAMQVVNSDAQGRYRVPALPIGDYDVQSEKAGFQTVTHKGITLTVGADQVADFSMPVGQVTQSVTVQAEVSQVETTSTEVSSLVSPTQMRELPLNGRNFEQLVLLAPGVTIMQAIGYNATQGMGNAFTVSGSRPEGQWEILDDNDVLGWMGRTAGAGVLGTSLGIDSIAEFKMLTNTYSAQYGGHGAVMTSVTKSGTNALHGSLYEFDRNSAFDARNFFDPPQIPQFEKNQFGGTLGGPIKKDKMFYFVNYEGIRQVSNPPYGFNLPDQDALDGFVNQVCVNKPALAYGPKGSAAALACQATIPAAIQPFMAYFPNPSQFVTGPDSPSTGTQEASVNMKSPAAENFVVGRYDWTLSSKDSLFARYLYDQARLFDVTSPVPSTLAPTGWSTYDNNRDQFLSVEEKRVWTNNVISSTRAGFSRTRIYVYVPTTENYQNGLYNFEDLSSYGFPEPALGGFQIASLTNPNFVRDILGGGANDNIIQNKFSGGEDIYWTKGAHAIQFGASITRQQSYRFVPPSSGIWNFSSVQTFLTQSPNTFTGTCVSSIPACFNQGVTTTPVIPSEYLENDYGFYIQDAWKVRPTVTLNLGLRYSPTSNPRNASSLGSLYTGINLPLSQLYNPGAPMPGCSTPSPTSCPVTLTGSPYTAVSTVYQKNPSYHTIDPRIGVAWDPFKDHKTSVRAGYGIFHFPITAFQYSSLSTGLVSYTQNCTSLPCSTFPLPFNSLGAAATPTSEGGIDPGVDVTAYMEQWNLTVQRELFRGTTLSVSYIGSHGVKLPAWSDENPELPSGVPGAITVPAAFPVPEYYAPVGNQLTGGTAVNPASANGQAVVDPVTGEMSYANVFCKVGGTSCEVLANNRIDRSIGFWSDDKDVGWSNYDAMEASLVRQLANGLQLQVSYTYASCITNSTGASSNDNQLPTEDSYNLNLDRGPCSFLLRQNFYANGVYVLPFHKNRLVSGWQLSGLYAYHTGSSIQVATGWSSSLINRSSTVVDNRPDLVPGCQSVYSPINLNHYFNESCYYLPPIGEVGNVGSQTLVGPDTEELDMSLMKNTKLSERFNLQLRLEAFNLLNRPNFRNAGQPVVPFSTENASTLTASCGTTPGTPTVPSSCAGPSPLGQTTLTNTTARQIQLGVKLVF